MTTITAKILAHSANQETGTEVVTFELEYPLVIHAHVLTHRVFSRNTASQRAIPVEKMIESVVRNPYIPLHWGANQPGMQSKDEEIADVPEAQLAWLSLRDDAIKTADYLHKLGLHKQYVNRLLATWQHTKVVVTTTDLENFFKLRIAADAQPEVQALAKAMKEAYEASLPVTLRKGEWHLPYIITDECGNHFYNGEEVSLEDAKAISAACCAAVSYRMEDMSVERAKSVYSRLGVGTDHFHASPFEHICTPWVDGEEVEVGNLVGFHQLRHLL